MGQGFAKSIRAFADKVPARFDFIKRYVGIQILTRVVYGTPVDKGRARGNWFVTLSEPETATTEDVDPDGGGTITRGISAIPASGLAGLTVFISNNLPYIVDLEQGHSQQGSYFVESAVQAFPAILAEAAEQSKRIVP